jgi:hypothetical protein
MRGGGVEVWKWNLDTAERLSEEGMGEENENNYECTCISFNVYDSKGLRRSTHGI